MAPVYRHAPESATTDPDSVPEGERRFVDDYLPALLAQASQLISSEFHQVVRSQGLSVSEWRVMASLAGRMVAKSEREISVKHGADLSAMIDGVDFVISQIRVGGMPSGTMQASVSVSGGQYDAQAGNDSAVAEVIVP